MDVKGCFSNPQTLSLVEGSSPLLSKMDKKPQTNGKNDDRDHLGDFDGIDGCRIDAPEFSNKTTYRVENQIERKDLSFYLKFS